MCPRWNLCSGGVLGFVSATDPRALPFTRLDPERYRPDSTVKINNRKKAFEVRTHSRVLAFPFVRTDPPPTSPDPVSRVVVDKELGREGFVYTLASGAEGTIHIEQVLEYNQDPGYLRELLYNLTIEAQKRVKESALSKREIIRRLGTSATQFYRILDQTNYRKSVDQVLNLLHVLECEVDLVVRAKSA